MQVSETDFVILVFSLGALPFSRIEIGKVDEILKFSAEGVCNS